MGGDLPSPEELMPLSQTLITPDLAMAFDIPIHHSSSTPSSSHHHHHQADFDSGDLDGCGGGGGGGSGGGEEPARTLKRLRLVWTPQLHKRFVDVVAHLGIKNAVPKTIMQLMSVDGLTRENVASHLQKYRLYLKRLQGLNSSGGGGAASCSPADAATDRLFASAPIPHQFLTRGGGGGGNRGGVAGPMEPPPPFIPFVPVAALQHHQQMVAAAASAAAQHRKYYQQRQMGFDQGFLRPPPPGFNRMGLHAMVQPVSASAYNMDALEEGNRGGGGGGRKVLTLFPTGDD